MMTSYYWIGVVYVIGRIHQSFADEQLLLGKSIYLPNEDLLGSIPNGITFFESISEECFRKMGEPTSIKEHSFYRNTGDFLKSIATQTGLKVGYETLFSLGTTLDLTTKSVSGGKRSVTGTSLNIGRKEFDTQLSPNCLYETSLQTRVLEDFSSLPTMISQPWFKESWIHYDKFLHQHGSHVITAVTFGSSINQYAFAEESSSYTEKQLTAKACAELPGYAIGAPGLSLSACAGLNKQDIENVSNAKMTTTITVRGGSLETRNRVLYDQSPDIILKFLDEGNTSPSPMKYKLTPIWQILNGQVQVKQTNPNMHIQAANMQYYFDGMLNFDCPYIPEDHRGPVLQLFNYAEHSTPENPVFQCSLAPEGCHHDKDCHLRIGFGCACYGKSCIVYETVEQISGNLKPTAKLYYKKDWTGAETCSWKTPGLSCRCKHEKQKRRVIF